MNKKQAAFLAAYAKSGNIRQAAKSARIGRRTHYHWIQHSEEYRAAFEDAKEDAADALEAQAWRLAHHKTRPNPILLMFLLKGLRPEKYRENARVEHTGELTLIAARLNAGRVEGCSLA